MVVERNDTRSVSIPVVFGASFLLLMAAFVCQNAVADDIPKALPDTNCQILPELTVALDAITDGPRQVDDLVILRSKFSEAESDCRHSPEFVALKKRLVSTVGSTAASIADFGSNVDLDELREREANLERLDPKHPKLIGLRNTIAKIDAARKAESLEANLEGYEELSFDDIFDALDTNILDREDVEDEVSTPLKRQRFLKSPEYKQMLAEARASRAALIGKKGYIHVSKEVGEYNLRSRQFVVQFAESNEPRGVVEGFQFPSVPFRAAPAESSGDWEVDAWAANCTSPDHVFFLPASTEDAEMIEGEEVEFYFLFTVGDAKRISYKNRYCPTGSYPMIETWSQNVIVAKNVTVVVVDSNGRIVFRRKY